MVRREKITVNERKSKREEEKERKARRDRMGERERTGQKERAKVKEETTERLNERHAKRQRQKEGKREREKERVYVYLCVCVFICVLYVCVSEFCACVCDWCCAWVRDPPPFLVGNFYETQSHWARKRKFKAWFIFWIPGDEYCRATRAARILMLLC